MEACVRILDELSVERGGVGIEEDEVAREKLAISLDDRCDSSEPATTLDGKPAEAALANGSG